MSTLSCCPPIVLFFFFFWIGFLTGPELAKLMGLPVTKGSFKDQSFHIHKYLLRLQTCITTPVWWLLLLLFLLFAFFCLFVLIKGNLFLFSLRVFHVWEIFFSSFTSSSYNTSFKFYFK